MEDDDGYTVGEVLADIGYRGNAEFDAASAAFVELHIEQGPTLEATGHDVGVVETITGISHSRVTITGEANHAGTTSMALRQDAFMGAAEFALDLEAAAWERAAETAAVGTVGKVGVSPNGTNVVPGEVELGVDIRDTDEESRQRLVETAKRRGREIADKRDVKFDWEDLLDVSAIPMADGVVETLDDACEAVGIDANRMPSGAGHDAMNVATVTPTGMLFVPSEGGVSHNPSEYTAPEDLAAGARVLERGLRSLAEV
jgi:N-carbamoyl-L-amino-acid hydrolase